MYMYICIYTCVCVFKVSLTQCNQEILFFLVRRFCYGLKDSLPYLWALFLTKSNKTELVSSKLQTLELPEKEMQRITAKGFARTL